MLTASWILPDEMSVESYTCTYSKLISFDTSAGGGQDAEKAHLSALAESQAEA
jgi:hypothetical protein